MVQRAVELLQQVGAPLRGIVLSGAGDRESYGYGYGGQYGHGYGERPEDNAAARKDKRSPR